MPVNLGRWLLLITALVSNSRAGRGDAPFSELLLGGAIETDEKTATDLAGLGQHINRSNLLVLESKADMQKRGQASPDDGDALALTFAQAVAPAEQEEERDEDDEFGGHSRINGPGAWMR